MRRSAAGTPDSRSAMIAMPVAGRPSKLGLSAQLFGSVSTPPGRGRRECPDRPAAIGLLMLPDHLDELLLPHLVEQVGHFGGCPEEQDSSVVMRRPLGLQIVLQMLHAGPDRRSFGFGRGVGAAATVTAATIA